jgi:hypothetical protein
MSFSFLKNVSLCVKITFGRIDSIRSGSLLTVAGVLSGRSQMLSAVDEVVLPEVRSSIRSVAVTVAHTGEELSMDCGVYS